MSSTLSSRLSSRSGFLLTLGVLFLVSFISIKHCWPDVVEQVGENENFHIKRNVSSSLEIDGGATDVGSSSSSIQQSLTESPASNVVLPTENKETNSNSVVNRITSSLNKHDNGSKLLLVSDNVEELLASDSPLGSISNSTEKKELVITFINSAYLDAFSVWLHYYKQHNHSRRILCLLATANSTFLQMKTVFESNQLSIMNGLGPTILTQTPLHGYSDSYLQQQNDRLGSLWVIRVQTIRRLLQRFHNINVLVTDLDALWVKDPQPVYLATQHALSDIVASRDVFPKDCRLAKENELKRKPATACAGFILYRNSPALRELMATTESIMPEQKFDDQRALNCALRQVPPADNNHTIRHNDGSITLSYQQSLTVTLLPYEQVQRRCRNDMFHVPQGDVSPLYRRIVVAHCLSNKEGEEKMESFQAMKLLPPNFTRYRWDTAAETQ